MKRHEHCQVHGRDLVRGFCTACEDPDAYEDFEDMVAHDGGQYPSEVQARQTRGAIISR